MMTTFMAIVCVLVYLLGALACWRLFRPVWWSILLWPLLSLTQAIELVFHKGDAGDEEEDNEEESLP